MKQSIKFLNILILIFTLQTISVLIGTVCWLSSGESHLQISLAVILRQYIIVFSLSFKKIRGLQSLFYLDFSLALPNQDVRFLIFFMTNSFLCSNVIGLWSCLFDCLFNLYFKKWNVEKHPFEKNLSKLRRKEGKRHTLTFYIG